MHAVHKMRTTATDVAHSVVCVYVFVCWAEYYLYVYALVQGSLLPLTDTCDAEPQHMHHMVIKPFLLLGLAAEYRPDSGCEQQLSDDHQKFMTLTGKLS